MKYVYKGFVRNYFDKIRMRHFENNLTHTDHIKNENKLFFIIELIQNYFARNLVPLKSLR